MDDWLFYESAGQYRPGLPKESDGNYYMFTPNPLSTDLKIGIDAELTSLLSAANRLLGQLEGMSGFLPNAAAISTLFIQKEALLSCQIDRINALFYNILDSSRRIDKVTAPIKRYASAMILGLEKLKTAQYKNTLLCEIHKALMNADDEERHGQFRTEEIFIGKIKTMSNSPPTYNPTSPNHLPRALCDLEKFICRNDDIDPLIKAALAHYQFETIHPFLSGNGRVGRILSYLILADKKVLTSPILCLSHYLNLNKVEYIDRMERLHRHRDYEQWIKFFIKAVIFAANDSLKSIKNWLCIREQNLLKIEKSGKNIKAIKPLYEVAERLLIFDVHAVARETGISYNTAAAALKLLAELKIVRQTNRMERNRDYACVDFLECFIGKDILFAPDDSAV